MISGPGGGESPVFLCLMTGPLPLPKTYPVNLWLCYRGVRYRPAALQLFVARGGWGAEYRQTEQNRPKAVMFPFRSWTPRGNR